MQNKLCKKGLVLATIFLFIGVGIHSAFAVETKSPLVNKQGNKDCGCDVDNNLLYIKSKRGLLELEIYSKILLVLFKDNIDAVEICEEILDIINSNRLLRHSIICKFLESLATPLLKIKDLVLHLLTGGFWPGPIMFDILISIYNRLYDIFEYVNHLYFIFECW